MAIRTRTRITRAVRCRADLDACQPVSPHIRPDRCQPQKAENTEPCTLPCRSLTTHETAT